MDESDRFDAWLERSLRAELGPPPGAAAPPVPAYARIASDRHRRRLPIFSSIGAALASKAVTGFAMTAFAVGLTGAAAVETVSTGSPLPAAVEHGLRSVAQDLGQPAPEPTAAPAVAQVPPVGQPITKLPEAPVQVGAQAHRESTPAPLAGPRVEPNRTEPDHSGPEPAPAGGGKPALAPAGRFDDGEHPSPSPSPSQRPGSIKPTGKPTPAPARALPVPVRPEGGNPEPDAN